MNRGAASAATWLCALGTLGAASGCEPRITTIGAVATSDVSHDAMVDAPPSSVADASLGQYLEAESGALEGGFVVGDDTRASRGQFIHPEVGQSSEDAAGPARASYELVATEPGTYLVWGRLHAQNISENRFWVQIDDEPWFKWRITTGDEWAWDAFHDNVDYGIPIPFALTAGTHRLVIANCVDGVGLDRLYYAPDHSRPEGDAPKCNPPHSIDLGGECNASCGSRAGSCGGPLCEGLESFATYDCAACCLPDQ